VSVSLARALAQFLGHPLDNEIVNQIAFEVEKIHHGTPSGIDNTVITYEEPVYFRKGEPPQRMEILEGFTLVIANSGTPSSTVQTVSRVRADWLQEQQKYESLFARIGKIVDLVREIIQTGNLTRNASLLTENHQLLREMGVSTQELDLLVYAALDAGAAGAKLSGGGGGGTIIAISESERIEAVVAACKNAGTQQVIVTQIPGTRGGRL